MVVRHVRLTPSRSPRRLISPPLSGTGSGASPCSTLLDTKRFERIPTEFTVISQVRAAPGRAVFIGAAASEAPALVELDLSDGRSRVIRRSFELDESIRRYVSLPESIAFPTEGGETAHAIYYPPFSPDFAAPEGEKAPALVLSHGGPTSSASSALSLETQYWTSRGVGVLDVSYRGSTGYGRAYRAKLEGRWGSRTFRTASRARDGSSKGATPTQRAS